jgi:molybdenum cofactor cytidylyltransferase
MIKETAIVILAAGESRRMGSPKQLLDFKGVPLLRHSVITALDADCGPVIVVLGSRANELRTAVADLPVEAVVNRRWSEGMGTSIQTGLQAIEHRPGVTGAILALADQPYISSRFFQLLASQHARSGKNIVASSYAGTVGVPAYFSRTAYPLLMALDAGQGCKGVILGNAEDRLLIDCPEAEIDVDTLEDYSAALNRNGSISG